METSFGVWVKTFQVTDNSDRFAYLVLLESHYSVDSVALQYRYCLKRDLAVSSIYL